MPSTDPAMNLGLDFSKVPNLAEVATRQRLTPAALKAFFRICELWNIKAEDARTLLGGISHGSFFELKRSFDGDLSQDQLTRISLLIGIFKALNILFSKKLADQWITRPNLHPIFGNHAPLQFILRGGVLDMLEVRRLLDSRRGGR